MTQQDLECMFAPYGSIITSRILCDNMTGECRRRAVAARCHGGGRIDGDCVLGGRRVTALAEWPGGAAAGRRSVRRPVVD